MDRYFFLISASGGANFLLVALALLFFSHNPYLVWLIGEVAANVFVYISAAFGALALSLKLFPRLPWYFPFGLVILSGLFLIWQLYVGKSYPIIQSGLVFWQTPRIAYLGLEAIMVVIFISMGILFVRNILRFPQERGRALAFSIVLPLFAVCVGLIFSNLLLLVICRTVAAIAVLTMYLLVANRQRQEEAA